MEFHEFAIGLIAILFALAWLSKRLTVRRLVRSSERRTRKEIRAAIREGRVETVEVGDGKYVNFIRSRKP